MSAVANHVVHQDNLPSIGLLALAVTLAAYILKLSNYYQPPVCVTGAILLFGGGLQLFLGVWSHKQGRTRSACALLPLGIFWLSLISYEIFPTIGLGAQPDPVTMFSFLSLWGLFLAVLFLGSFRQSVAIQALYGFMMFSFVALGMDHLRDDNIFLMIGCGTGIAASLIALYIALAENLNHLFGRTLLPLGKWSRFAEEGDDAE
jgi:succinate-acetate transporter protein